jgi:predicted O-methyltransferase YrrM
MNIDEIVEQSKASIEKNDLKILLTLLSPLNIKRCCEIGTWKGYSARVWLDAFEPEKFMTIENDEKTIVEEWAGKKGCDSLYAKCDSHVESSLVKVKEFFGSNLIDFLFIDGDHSYQGVKKDWEMYGPLVKKGGVIVFHDVCYVSDDPLAPVQVTGLWYTLKKQYPYVEIKSSKSSTGMGILYV